MGTSPRWSLSAEEQQAYINALTEALAPLRAKIGISQSELAYLAGVSRQTYSAIENGRKPMSWSSYLSLVMLFDSVQETHRMLRDMRAFPEDMVERFNKGLRLFSINDVYYDAKAGRETADMLRALDESGIRTLQTTLLVEYARCTNATEKVLKVLQG